ncbi:MAG: hypothetical protein FWH41_07975, partial [Treponema sp.]|nr:hypothetical protein [Treponema sp.]
LFLDEGWSHLTENLCGLGISGGNINFLKRYFEDTSMYSLCGPNRDGYDDSAGMRGAISLFLSWLFWEAGGLSWDSADPVKLIDQGGIAFLRRMVESPQAGWESIGLAFGKPVPRLFNDFLNGMHNYRISNRAYNYKTDPSTNEAVDFFVNMGGSVGVGFPRSSPALNAISLEPWSFAFFDQFMLEDDALLTLEAGKTAGSVFYSYSVR